MILAFFWQQVLSAVLKLSKGLLIVNLKLFIFICVFVFEFVYEIRQLLRFRWQIVLICLFQIKCIGINLVNLNFEKFIDRSWCISLQSRCLSFYIETAMVRLFSRLILTLIFSFSDLCFLFKEIVIVLSLFISFIKFGRFLFNAFKPLGICLGHEFRLNILSLKQLLGWNSEPNGPLNFLSEF